MLTTVPFTLALNSRARTGDADRAAQWLSPNAAAILLLLAAGLARAQAFPAEFDLGALRPEAGGDGSAGVIFEGTVNYSVGEISPAGDINADGISDMLIGSNFFPIGAQVGLASALFGTVEGFPPVLSLDTLLQGDGSQGVVFVGTETAATFGSKVSAVGDLNADGVDDIMIGAFGQEGFRGGTYTVFGRMEGFPARFLIGPLLENGGGDGSEGFLLRGLPAAGGTSLGAAISPAGDWNGDGIHDAIVGAPGTRFGTGEAYVLYGRSTGFEARETVAELLPLNGGDGSEGVALVTGVPNGDLGLAVAGDCDLNGDGIADIAVRENPTVNSDGTTYVVFGDGDGFDASFSVGQLRAQVGGDGSAGFVVIDINLAQISNRNLGTLACLGDVNGDGVDDLGIGDPGFDPQISGSLTYILYGSTEGFAPNIRAQDWLSGASDAGSLVYEPAPLAELQVDPGAGFFLAGVGDINGDGIDDFATGSWFGSDSPPTDGAVYVVFGTTEGFPRLLNLADLRAGRGGDGSAGFVIFPEASGERLGAVEGVGDVNADGIDDIAVSAIEGRTENVPGVPGKAYVIFGRRPAGF